MNSSVSLSMIPYVAALSTGVITLCSTIFLFLRQKNRIYLYLNFLLFSLLSKLVYVIFELYFNGSQHQTVFLILKTIKALGVSVFLFVLPALINHIMLSSLNVLKRIILSVISISVFIMFVLERFLDITIPYSYIVSNIIFILILVYCIITVLLNLRDMTDRRQKKIVTTFFVLAVIFLPMTIIDFITGGTGLQVPVFFIVICILGIIFSFFYLIPPTIISNDQLDQYLKSRYKITRREKEIITLIRNGYSNNAISDKTSISISTVEKHINSIYRKLDIRNRVQLINFIQSGMQ
jgi:DNA-binding CsgD family transcriptional regulator